MQLTIEASKLSNTLQRVQACVAKRTSIDMYKRILCEANDDGLIITATDLESWMQVRTPASVLGDGKTVLPHKELKAIADKSEGELSFNISQGSTMIEVSGEGSQYNLALMEPDGFAPIQEREVDEWLHTTAWELIRALRLTLFSVSEEEGKFAMRGILFEAANSTLSLASTDSKRLSVAEAKLSEPRTSEKVWNALIGKNCCNLLLQNLLRIPYGTPVKIGLNYNNCYFKTEDSVLMIRLSEGRFPPFRDVIPKLNKMQTIKLNREGFLVSLERLKMMLDDECRRVKLNINGTSITMNITHTKVGEGQVIHLLDQPASVPVVLNFDPEFLLELLANNELNDEVAFHYLNSNKSVLFTSDRYTHLIVPLT